MKRQVVLDTETTGLEPTQGHRIIEVAGVELLGGRRTGKTVRYFVNPERKIPKRATEIHGITDNQVVDKPTFFQIGLELLDFLSGAELIIHNAPFDVKFLNSEFKRAGFGAGVIKKHCTVLDTLRMAREIWPGRPNSLDTVCQRVGVDLSDRTHHSALLDAELLADAYLIMVTIAGKEAKKETGSQAKTDIERAPVGREARWGSGGWLVMLALVVGSLANDVGATEPDGTVGPHVDGKQYGDWVMTIPVSILFIESDSFKTKVCERKK